MSKQELNEAVVARLARPMAQVWDQISMEIGDEIENNSEAVELVIDANRLDLLGNDREADDLVRALIEAHGYEAVLAYLGAHVVLHPVRGDKYIWRPGDVDVTPPDDD